MNLTALTRLNRFEQGVVSGNIGRLYIGQPRGGTWLALNFGRHGKQVLSIHRYPTAMLLFDGFRAILGLTATLGPLLFLDVTFALVPVLALLGLVFLLFAGRLTLQGLSSIELSCQAIIIHGPAAHVLAWHDLTALKLAHYAAPRQRSDGWYQLMLSGNGKVLKLESTIEGFDTIVEAALEAAIATGLVFDPTTGDNLTALGYQPNRQHLAQ